MKVVLLGAPGVGKGTQALEIKKKWHIPKISTGDMLRAAIEANTPTGQGAKAVMDKGGLVDDTIMIALVKERIALPDCVNGFLFDGFPRTIPQAEALREANILIDYVIELTAADDVIIQRLVGRRVHLPSGRNYHVQFAPPRVPGKDDITGEDLVQREDDKEDTIKERLKIYRQQTEVLVGYYKKQAAHSPFLPKYIRVDGTDTVENVRLYIFKYLGAHGH